jgi:hypothetical protein
MEYIRKAKLSQTGFNKGMFSNSDKIIHYYFETTNKVTQDKIDVFIENGFVPSNECMMYLENRMKRNC